MRRASAFRHEGGEHVLRTAEHEVSWQRRRGGRVEAATEGEIEVHFLRVTSQTQGAPSERPVRELRRLLETRYWLGVSAAWIALRIPSRL
jgi:predicted nucleic acid-binding Zn ribbon protein